MEIVSNHGVYSPQYKSVTEVKRSQPESSMVNQPISPQPQKETPKYNWKTIAVVAGVSALALLGIGNRKNIAKIVKNITKETKPQQQYHNPNMNVIINNTKAETGAEYFPPSQIRESFEPEKLSDFILKKDRINQKRHKNIILIDQEGRTVKKEGQSFDTKNQRRTTGGFNFRNRDFSSQRMNRDNQQSGYTVNDAVDDAINFAIIDDIVNGGKEVKGAFDFVKNAFKGKGSETVMDKGMSSVDDAVASGGSTVGDFFSNIGEKTSTFVDDMFKSASDMADSFGDGLGDFADSLGDIV